MLVLNKKRISIVILCVLVSVFSFIIASTDKREENTVPTTATPVSGRTIVVDAGHGVPDERGTK